MDKAPPSDVNHVDQEDQDVFEDALDDDSTVDNNTSIPSSTDELTDLIDKPKDDKEVLDDSKNSTNAIEDKVIEVNNNELRIREKIRELKAYTMEDGIDKCIRSAFELNMKFFNDEFGFVLEFCRINYDKNVFYSLIYSTMYFIRTWMSFEQPEIRKCLEILNQCADYVNSRRRVFGWSDMIKKIDYNEGFTDEEVFAEITYGELQILIGATTFIKDQNFSSLFKGALRFKQGYQSFKFCKDIYHNRTQWSSKSAQEEFKCSLQSGSGVFYLSLSMAPPKVTQLLEFVGFVCDENFALETLQKEINLENAIKSNYALMVLLIYYSYTQVSIGYGNYQLDEFEKLVKLAKKRNPTSLFTNYFVAKELQLTGEIDKSILKFREITNSSKDYLKQVNNACNWELLSLYAVKKEYKECARIADVLRSSSLWSPCVFTFIYGTCLYMIKEETGNQELQDEIDECFREVPRLRRRLAGKSTPIEKLAMSKFSYYFAHDRKLMLPLNELMFYYNLVCIFKRNKVVMNENLKLIEDKLKQYDVSQLIKLGQANDYCLLLMMKASYLRHLDFPSIAIETLEQIFLYSKEIEENHLLPFATQELAFCYLQLGQYEYAKRLIKSCLSRYTRYTAELILHFRAYNAIREIKKKIKETNVQQKVQNNNFD